MTAAGLVFIAGTVDPFIRAFDIETGKELWKAPLPASGAATPMTYMTKDGRQAISGDRRGRPFARQRRAAERRVGRFRASITGVSQLSLHEFLLKCRADGRENVFSHLPLAFGGKMDEIDELLVFAVKMRMRIDEADFRVFRRQLADDERMDRVGPHESIGGARAAAAVKVDDLRVAGLDSPPSRNWPAPDECRWCGRTG